MLKSLINRSARLFGYEFKPTRTSFPKLTTDPLPAGTPSAWHYMMKTNYRAVLPLLKGRALAERFEDFHYYEACKSYLKRGSSKEVEKILTNYQLNRAPQTAAEKLGLQPGTVEQLDDEPGWFTWLPWDARPIEELKEKEVNRRLDPTSGSSGFTKTAEEFARFETGRILSLLNSVKKKGYRPNEYQGAPVCCEILINQSNEYYWVVKGGFHRTAVCAALGMTTIEVLVEKIIYKRDAEFWPGVASGTVDRQAALTIFDNIFTASRNSKR